MTNILTLSLLLAISSVESGHDASAIGDGGRSVGRMQIGRAVLADVNRRHGTRYQPADRLDPSKSLVIARLYLATYCTPERLGRPVTQEDAARIWNGGPDGWRQPGTAAYWRRVRSRLHPKP